VKDQSVQVPRPPRTPDLAGPLACGQPGMSSRLGKVFLGPGIVQPQSFLCGCQPVSPPRSPRGSDTPAPVAPPNDAPAPHRRRHLEATEAGQARLSQNSDKAIPSGSLKFRISPGGTSTGPEWVTPWLSSRAAQSRISPWLATLKAR
jgi:hypothetical protein